MIPMKAIKRWLTSASACVVLLGCANPHVSTAPQNPARHSIQISEMTLNLESPSLLRPSRDFPPPKVASEFRLDQVDSLKTLFNGWWDGPRYQLLTVTGTMRILMAVGPWPDEAQGVEGCQAKARSVADSHLARQMVHYTKGHQSLPPRMAFESMQLAGRQSYHYKFSSQTRFNYYIIPLTRSHYIILLISSADNSPMKGEWPELFARANAAFLQSLELVGDETDCR